MKIDIVALVKLALKCVKPLRLQVVVLKRAAWQTECSVVVVDVNNLKNGKEASEVTERESSRMRWRS